MSYWLTYELCEKCEICRDCEQSDRLMSLRVLEADQPPSNAVNGPADDVQQLLSIWRDHFVSDGQGYLRLKGGRPIGIRLPIPWLGLNFSGESNLHKTQAVLKLWISECTMTKIS